jgi:MYXO-CTERM domain-containing protein
LGDEPLGVAVVHRSRAIGYDRPDLLLFGRGCAGGGHDGAFLLIGLAVLTQLRRSHKCEFIERYPAALSAWDYTDRHRCPL